MFWDLWKFDIQIIYNKFDNIFFQFECVHEVAAC